MEGLGRERCLRKLWAPNSPSALAMPDCLQSWRRCRNRRFRDAKVVLHAVQRGASGGSGCRRGFKGASARVQMYCLSSMSTPQDSRSLRSESASMYRLIERKYPRTITRPWSQIGAAPEARVYDVDPCSEGIAVACVLLSFTGDYMVVFTDTTLPSQETSRGSERTISTSANYSTLPRVTRRAPRDSHRPHHARSAPRASRCCAPRSRAVGR